MRQTTADKQRAVRAWWWRHPELPVVVAIAGCWAALAVHHWDNHAGTTVWQVSLPAWTAMVVAMMLPGALPMMRWVAFNSLWSRRHRHGLLFVATYLGAWTAFAGFALAVVAVGERLVGRAFIPGRWEVTVVLIAAAIWQFTASKRRSLRRCHRRTPLAASGMAASRSVIRYGLFHSRACIGSCWVVMMAMFIAAHDFHLMVPLTALALYERMSRKPNMQATAAALVVIAIQSAI